jgi:hypothetical protein
MRLNSRVIVLDDSEFDLFMVAAFHCSNLYLSSGSDSLSRSRPMSRSVHFAAYASARWSERMYCCSKDRREKKSFVCRLHV